MLKSHLNSIIYFRRRSNKTKRIFYAMVFAANFENKQCRELHVVTWEGKTPSPLSEDFSILSEWSTEEAVTVYMT
jgi:hypothetical protein